MPLIDQRQDKINRLRTEADAQDVDATHCLAAAKVLAGDPTEVIGRDVYFRQLATELELRGATIKAFAAAKRENATAIEQRLNHR